MALIEERCRAFEEDLSALIDGELGAEHRAVVEVHVAGCASCSARIAALRAVDGALAGLPSPAVPPALRARLARRIAAEGGRRAPPPALRRGRALRLLALPAAAAAALALYLALRAPGPPGGPALPEPAPIAKAPARVLPGPELQVAKAEPAPPAVEPAPEPAPETAPRVAEGAPPPAPGAAELEALDSEELAVVLDLDTIEDLPVIANLELLERLLGEDAG